MSRAPAAAPASDGRRRRAEDSRARIVAAMLEIIHAGEVTPSAEQVAQRADVGLRTVFRHFQDMESLYREMSGVIEGELRAVVERPFQSGDWRERILELIERRAGAFERVGPFLRASMAFRYRSEIPGGHDNTRLVAALREILKRQLPPGIARDPLKLEILDLLLSFGELVAAAPRTGLRRPSRAREALAAAVRRLLDA